MVQQSYQIELVGGPADGEKYTVPYPRETILLPVLPKERSLGDYEMSVIEFQEAVYFRRHHDERAIYLYDFKGYNGRP